MSNFDILAEGADNNTSGVIERLSQRVLAAVIPQPVHSMAQRCADQSETYILGESSPYLEMGRCDRIDSRVLPKFMDGKQVLVYAGIIC